MVVGQKSAQDAMAQIVDYIRCDQSETTDIVYCHSIGECQQLAETLKSNGVTALPYHSKLNADIKKATYNQ